MQIFATKKKALIALIAMLISGGFIFTTWIVEYNAKRQPSWDLSFTNINEPILSYKDNYGAFYEGNFNIENKGNINLEVYDTTLKFFLLPRPNIEGFTNYTGYSFEKYIRDNEIKPIKEIQIGQLDNSPIFPNNIAIRPFSVVLFDGNDRAELENKLLDKILIIRSHQQINYQNILGFTKEVTARNNYTDLNIGGVTLSNK